MRVIVSCLFLFVFVAVAFGQVYCTNAVTQTEAIRAASRLEVGMWQEQASRQLATNRLTNTEVVGAVSSWETIYGLSDGTSLHLSYRAREPERGGRWGGKGVLVKAFIQGNGVNTVFIVPTNAP
jgi:hypothetical protein